ncbi:MAG: class I adenylate-forming enzyme family protein [Jatrophihabitans sp.]
MTVNLAAELLHHDLPDTAAALTSPQLSLSRGELRQWVAGHRAELVAAGVGPGSTVAIQVAPSFNYLAVVLAGLQLDSRLLLLHHRLAEAEFAELVDPLRPAATVRSLDGAAISRFVPRREVLVQPRPDADRSGPGAAIVQFSSGSTGRPKIIQRGEQSICRELAALERLPGWVSGADTLLTLNSLVHSFGLFGALFHGLRVGATVALPSSALPRELSQALDGLRPTAITGVPAHFELLAALPVGALAGVHTCVSGGQLVRPAAQRAFVARQGCQLGQVYGLTEAGLVAADITGEFAPAMGRPLHPGSVTVVAGEVVLEQPELPYLGAGDPARWRAGQLYTGDRGRLDGEVLSVTGRSDSLVAIGGLKLDLAEIERLIGAAPGVREVVVLVREQHLEAFVEADEQTADTLRDWCRDRLSAHKQPRRIVVHRQLPRTLTGKAVRGAELLRLLEAAAT